MVGEYFAINIILLKENCWKPHLAQCITEVKLPTSSWFCTSVLLFTVWQSNSHMILTKFRTRSGGQFYSRIKVLLYCRKQIRDSHRRQTQKEWRLEIDPLKSPEKLKFKLGRLQRLHSVVGGQIWWAWSLEGVGSLSPVVFLCWYDTIYTQQTLVLDLLEVKIGTA